MTYQRREQQQQSPPEPIEAEARHALREFTDKLRAKDPHHKKEKSPSLKRLKHMKTGKGKPNSLIPKKTWKL